MLFTVFHFGDTVFITVHIFIVQYESVSVSHSLYTLCSMHHQGSHKINVVATFDDFMDTYRILFKIISLVKPFMTFITRVFRIGYEFVLLRYIQYVSICEMN